jgi:hypothetical protein
MAIDFEKWNAEFGGEQAVKDIEKAKESAGNYGELPEGTYVCKLEKLELGESKAHKPMVKAMFRIVEGEHKKQCIFYNGVMVANNPEYNGLMKHRVLEFLRSLNVLDDSDIDFDGNYAHFNDLLLDIAEAAEEDQLKFEVFTEKDGQYTTVTVTDTFE